MPLFHIRCMPRLTLLLNLMTCCASVVVGVGCSDSASSTVDTEDSSVKTMINGSNALVKESNFGPAPAGKVLRHTVFFSFRESTSEEAVKEVVEAFCELPSKIEEIIDFSWGVNNSPEPFDDGYTHCFVLTFRDEAGRNAYLPHPAHKQFGSVVSGKNDQTFVIDYWGTPLENPPDRQLKHAVFFRFTEDATEEGIKQVEEAFVALPSKIVEIKGFEWGINNSPETKSDGFTHCFMVSFESEDGRRLYLDHPDHLAFVEVLKPILDAARVLDFWAEK
ncbi:MAG: Dabb family protein [Fuerstiella sp.]|nr:Dabb family protein [Fuerstiella sp.]